MLPLTEELPLAEELRSALTQTCRAAKRPYLLTPTSTKRLFQQTLIIAVFINIEYRDLGLKEEARRKKFCSQHE